MSIAPARPHRGTIFLDDRAEVLDQRQFPGNQHILRMRSPRCASAAVPGSFVHVRCSESLPMRRPLSIMRVDVERGTLDILYKVQGQGLAQLAQCRAGQTLSVLGPIGNGFALHARRRHALLIGGGVGIPPLIFLADRLRADMDYRSIAFFGSELAFPFPVRPSKLVVPGMPVGAIATLPMLEDHGVPCRLASLAGFPGFFEGYVTDLAGHYLQALDPTARGNVELFACGPTVMLMAVARLARRFDLPAQLCLEEFMACAVGGCAGCAVRVEGPSGIAMKRVCVDGPVFEASQVFAAGSNGSVTTAGAVSRS